MGGSANVLVIPSDTPGREQVLAIARATNYTERQVAEMATENQDETSNGTTSETEGQAAEQGQQQEVTPETGGNDTSEGQQSQEQRLPDDHPLVKAYASSQSELKTLRSSSQAHQAKVTELETKIAELTTKAESTDTVQGKFDRLEAFLLALPGPLGKALDSRSFTDALFNSDKSIEDILKDWQRANPTATSQALGAGAGDPGKKAPTMNELLRAAAGS